MKRFISVSMLAVALTACSHNQPAPATSATATVKPCDETADKKADGTNKDRFDAAGDVAGEAVADGSRWAWSTAKKTWQWIDTPEHREEAKKQAEELKRAISDAMKSDKKP